MNNFKCVIEVHKSEFLDNLFYHVGVVESPKKVAWGSRTKYESGLFPTVSLNDNNVVVEMHQTKEGSLVYAFGELDISNRVIQFGAWIKLIERGTTPRIALGINAVVEVHQENGNQLCYTLGVLQASSKTIQWGNFNLFDRGSNPCITVGGQDYLNIIITHQMKDSLFCNVGRISLANMNVKWNGITLYAKGRLPQVANNCKNFVLSVHKSPDNSDLNYDLAYSLPCIVESVQGVGVSSDPNKNYRSSMEDEHIVIDQFNSYDSLYVGVYDGFDFSILFFFFLKKIQSLYFFKKSHGGRQAVELVRDHLHNFVLKAIEKYGLPDQHNEVNKMWNEAFAETDKLVIQYSALEEREDKSGSTAAVALIWSINGERYLETANIGDARTVLIRGGKAVRLSYDHKANDPAEKQRMEAGGAVVLMDKVCAILSVSRAFGDSEFKKWVICEPYTMSTKLTVEDTHLIVACDGLWDVVDDQVKKKDENCELFCVTFHSFPNRKLQILS